MFLQVFNWVVALDDSPAVEKTLQREFYANRFHDHLQRASVFLNAALSAVLMGKDADIAMKIAGKIIAPIDIETAVTGANEVLMSLNSVIGREDTTNEIDAINPPMRDHSVSPRHRALIERYASTL